MSRSTKWKLAVIAGISECLVYAEAKYCAFEIHGEPKYYVCPRTEYCCNFGCCVSPGYQIYHLWYYWLLVIIMFLVCSGGGWWYRYWLQGRYRAAASAIPSRSSSSRVQNPLRGPTCQAQQARISYNTARNTVLLHRMWKAQRSVTSPAYCNAGGAASSATHYQNTSVVLNDANCPYYQLYGPPPSYETVIAQTRGKMSSPSSSPELRVHPRVLQPPASSTGDAAFQCYYNVAARMPLEAAPQYQQQQQQPAGPTAGFDTAEYVRLVQQYGPEAAMIQSPRHQLARPKLLTDSEVEQLAAGVRLDSPVEGGFTITNCIDSSCALDRQLHTYSSIGRLSSRPGVHGQSRRGRYDSASSSQSELLSGEPVATTSSSLGFEHYPASLTHQQRTSSSLRKGGSLKIPRRREQLRQMAKRRLSSGAAEDAALATLAATASTSSSAAGVAATSTIATAATTIIASSSQPSPSSNVISAAAATAHQDQLQPQQCSPSSTNSNLESRRKLDRSRSLE